MGGFMLFDGRTPKQPLFPRELDGPSTSGEIGLPETTEGGYETWAKVKRSTMPGGDDKQWSALPHGTRTSPRASLSRLCLSGIPLVSFSFSEDLSRLGCTLCLMVSILRARGTVNEILHHVMRCPPSFFTVQMRPHFPASSGSESLFDVSHYSSPH
jgi:hypothetical protein